MFRPKLVLLFPFLLVCGSVSASDVSTHARNAVDAIRQLREIGMPNAEHPEAGPPSKVPGLLKKLNSELRALIIEALNDKTPPTPVSEDEIFDRLRAAGWEEIPSQKWNAYGEIRDINFDWQVDYTPGILVVSTQLWVPCGADDPDSTIYVFQGIKRTWDLVLATDSDFDWTGWKKQSGMEYALSPPNSTGKWFLVVGTVPPLCRRTDPMIRYRALRPTGNPDKPMVLVEGRVAANPEYEPPFRVEAHEDWFAVTAGRTRKIDGTPGVGIFRYDVSGKEARRIPPLALTAEDFLEQWSQTDWTEAKQWSGESGGLFEWHEKLRGVTPGSAEIAAVRRCKGTDDSDQVFSIQLDVDQKPNPNFGPQTVYVEVGKRNGIFSVDGVRGSGPSGCAEQISITSVTERTLPSW